MYNSNAHSKCTDKETIQCQVESFGKIHSEALLHTHEWNRLYARKLQKTQE